MNNSVFWAFPVFLAFVFMGLSSPERPLDNENPADKESIILSAVVKFLKQIHFRPKAIDDNLSQKIYDIYLEQLDGNKRFLTQKDYDVLHFYRDKVDDQVKMNSFAFFDLSVNLLERGIERSKNFTAAILSEPFSFSNPDNFESDYKKRAYASDELALEAHWYKILKYDVLSRVSNKLGAQEAEDFEGEKLSVADLEAEARKDVKVVYDQFFERRNLIRRSDHFASYINSLTHIHDPHSDYYSPKEKADFDINMSGRLEGIGARLSFQKNMTKIVSIVPGGPAWKEGSLQVDDYITDVKQDGEEPVSIIGWRIDDVVMIIRGKKDTKVTLTIKKVDGSVEDVLIVRDEVIIADGNAKSAIIKHSSTDKKYGYIHLPRFYADFERPDGRNCSRDVKLELEKLKKEGVDGVVLDLRNNGGGSLRDVVDMSGLFIEDGAIVQVKSREKKAKVLKDTDSEVAYDGPLVVLVNKYSASASEILAAALQDYKRAVIVGSKTFGKGTVQRFYDLDRAVSGIQDVKPLGEVKLTTQKFYRINGGSTQLEGVTPDITLPYNYSYIPAGEKRYDYPMEWSEIEPVEYGQTTYVVDNIDSLRQQSENRVANHADFSLIDSYAHYLKDQEDDSNVPLQLDAYRAYRQEIKDVRKKFSGVMKDPIESLAISSLVSDYVEIEKDEGKLARNEAWLVKLSKDIYIEEGLMILRDMKSVGHN